MDLGTGRRARVILTRLVAKSMSNQCRLHASPGLIPVSFSILRNDGYFPGNAAVMLSMCFSDGTYGILGTRLYLGGIQFPPVIFR